jgi:hypothetical protein
LNPCRAFGALPEVAAAEKETNGRNNQECQHHEEDHRAASSLSMAFSLCAAARRG